MLAQWMSSVSMALPSPTIKLELRFFSSTLLFWNTARNADD